MILSVDFETRSRLDLRRVGVHKYVEHPSTDVWCMAFAFDDEEPYLWLPGEPVWKSMLDHIRSGGEMRAWNAQFERVIWREILGPRYGFPVPALEQWVDTAAEAAAMALPRKLRDAARVLGVEAQVGPDKNALILQMCRPRVPTKKNPREWWDTPEKLTELYEACKQDVRAERAVAHKLRRLNDHERQVYLLDQRINDRGVRIDAELVRAAQDVTNIAKGRADAELSRLTGGAVSNVTKVADMKQFLGRDSLTKAVVRDMLAGDELSEQERAVVELRASAGKSSTAKLDKMLETMCADGRVRGLLLYHGASTGRWAGKGIQVQNFPKPKVKDVERYIPAVLARDLAEVEKGGPAIHVISSMLRSMLVAAPGYRLIAGDFSSIEARIVAWIAEQNDLVEAFASGAKIYEGMAARIYGMPASDVKKGSRERDVGKFTALGCGFQMGWQTHQERIQIETGIRLSDDEAKACVDAYRELCPLIVQFWFDIERAARVAVEKPGLVTTVGRNAGIRFQCEGPWLWCRLPSGRRLAYAQPIIAERETKWGRKVGVQAMGVSSVTHQWTVQHLYGGHLTENVVQGMAADLLRSAMLRAERHGYTEVMTVHDEIVAEAPNGFGSAAKFERLMCVRPRWAEGLPVAVEAWEGERYRK